MSSSTSAVYLWSYLSRLRATAYLLLEVSTIFLVDEDKVQKVANRELLVDVSHGRRQVVAVQKQPNWYRLA